jgi:hypothetical protein
MVLISTTEEIACSPAHLRKVVHLPPQNPYNINTKITNPNPSTHVVPRLPPPPPMDPRLHPRNRATNPQQVHNRSRRQTHRQTRRDDFLTRSTRTSTIPPQPIRSPLITSAPETPLANVSCRRILRRNSNGAGAYPSSSTATISSASSPVPSRPAGRLSLMERSLVVSWRGLLRGLGVLARPALDLPGLMGI